MKVVICKFLDWKKMVFIGNLKFSLSNDENIYWTGWKLEPFNYSYTYLL
jgi:hypothetical protein